MPKFDENRPIMRMCWLFLLGCTLLYSCTKEPVYIETVTVSENPYLIKLDTFQINAVVYRLDSFQTGNTGLVLAGVHKDVEIGTTSSKAYFQFKLPAVDYNDVGGQQDFYDSIVFTAKLNPSYYGDTTSEYKVNIHALTEEIYREDNLFYNVTSFQEEAGSLGSFQRKIRPRAGDSVRIKMNNTFGNQLFQYYREKNAIIRSDVEFQRWFRGIKMMADASITNVLYSFPTADTNVSIRLYYHTDVAVREQKYLTFSLSGAAKDFSEVTTNTTGGAFAVVTPGASVSAAAIGNRFLFFPLAGIRTGFTFPTIKTIPGFGDFVQLMTAQLKLYPNSGSYRTYALPDSLNMYFRLPDLSYEGPLASLSGDRAQSGALIVDDLNGVNTYYTWDIPSYISTEMSSNFYTERTLVPLSETPPGSVSNKWYGRLIGSLGGDRKSTLSIQLLVYQSNN